MNKILALWAVPRSRSSAFTLMMQRRGDFLGILEPFEASAYFSDERIIQRYPSKGPEANYGNVLNKLLNLSRARKVFIKDHAYYIEHLADAEFLSHFQHSFLIRDPAQSLPSYFDKWPDVTLQETGYRELASLFDKVMQYTGEVPPLIDADDLVENPEAIIKAYCEQTGIPFLKHALRWPRVTKRLGIWHDHLMTTTGFEERPGRSYLEVDQNEHLTHLYKNCMPYYEKLSRYKIRVDE
jgi:hypothetical protein